MNPFVNDLNSIPASICALDHAVMIYMALNIPANEKKNTINISNVKKKIKFVLRIEKRNFQGLLVDPYKLLGQEFKSRV